MEVIWWWWWQQCWENNGGGGGKARQSGGSEEEKTIEMRVVIFVLKGKQEICMYYLTEIGAEVYRELSYLENDIRALRSDVDHLNGTQKMRDNAQDIFRPKTCSTGRVI